MDNWDLKKKANIAIRAFNDHVTGCNRCDPRRDLCRAGTKLEAVAHNASNRVLEDSIRRKEAAQ